MIGMKYGLHWKRVQEYRCQIVYDTKFAKIIKKTQKETGVVLRKYQEEIKRQVDREKKEVEEQKKEDKIILSTKDLVFKERLVKKVDRVLCEAICYRESSVEECSKVTSLYENSSSSKCQ